VFKQTKQYHNESHAMEKHMYREDAWNDHYRD